MTQTTADRQIRSRAAARLLLALLLVFAPLLAIAAGMPTTVTTGDGVAPTAYSMPCHPTGAEPLQSAEPAQQDACPHCAGDGPASQCHCCGYAAPAGLNLQIGVLTDSHPDELPLRMLVTDRLPESAGDRLYRPPIARG